MLLITIVEREVNALSRDMLMRNMLYMKLL